MSLLDEIDTAPYRKVEPGSPTYVPARSNDLFLGDIVRRIGHPLRVGIVQAVHGEIVLVQWYPDGPIDRRHVTLLQRRVER